MMLEQVAPQDFFWVLENICSVYRKPFSMPLAQQQLAAPHTRTSLRDALCAYGFQVTLMPVSLRKIKKEPLPFLVWLRKEVTAASGHESDIPALILHMTETHVSIASAVETSPQTITIAEFSSLYTGHGMRIKPLPAAANDADSSESASGQRHFGFQWFVPELLKHKKLWQEVLLASLVIQLIALVTPLFTQTIIDKVVVHRTQSTLIVIAIGMAIFMFFSAGLTWLRQYLILHTGNRVDATLGAAVFGHLLKLPPL